MYLENVIQLIIGLVFSWFVLSTATVQIQEWIASHLHWRADELEHAIQRMLNDRGLTKLLYDHPIIRSLSESGYRPSYIPSKQFSTVLMTIIQSAGKESTLLIHGLYSLQEKLTSIKPLEKRKRAQADLDRIFELARLSGSTDGGKAIDNLILATLEKEIKDFGDRYEEVKDAIQSIRQKASTDREQIEGLSNSFPNLDEKSGSLKTLLTGTLALGVINPGLRLALNTLLIGVDKPELKAEDSLALLQANIETWFNDSMDRLSGWYKRKAQLAAFLIGLIGAMILNVDTIQLASQLWREPALREAINSHVELVLQEYSGGNTGVSDPISAIEFVQQQYLGLPIGWDINAVKLLPTETCSFVPGPGQVFGFNWNNECRRPFGAETSTNGWFWLLAKAAGLLMTASACAQGSSFWFDMLMKIVNVRSAGIKPV